jgi:hypothetical protein
MSAPASPLEPEPDPDPDVDELFSGGFPAADVIRSPEQWLSQVVRVCRQARPGHLAEARLLSVALQTLYWRCDGAPGTLLGIIDAAYELACRADGGFVAWAVIIGDAITSDDAAVVVHVLTRLLNAARQNCPVEMLDACLDDKVFKRLVDLLPMPFDVDSGVVACALELLVLLPGQDSAKSVLTPGIVGREAWGAFWPRDDAERSAYSGVVCRIIREIGDVRTCLPRVFEAHVTFLRAVLPRLVEEAWANYDELGIYEDKWWRITLLCTVVVYGDAQAGDLIRTASWADEFIALLQVCEDDWEDQALVTDALSLLGPAGQRRAPAEWIADATITELEEWLQADDAPPGVDELAHMRGRLAALPGEGAHMQHPAAWLSARAVDLFAGALDLGPTSAAQRALEIMTALAADKPTGPALARRGMHVAVFRAAYWRPCLRHRVRKFFSQATRFLSTAPDCHELFGVLARSRGALTTIIRTILGRWPGHVPVEYLQQCLPALASAGRDRDWLRLGGFARELLRGGDLMAFYETIYPILYGSRPCQNRTFEQAMESFDVAALQRLSEAPPLLRRAYVVGMASSIATMLYAPRRQFELMQALWPHRVPQDELEDMAVVAHTLCRAPGFGPLVDPILQAYSELKPPDCMKVMSWLREDGQMMRQTKLFTPAFLAAAGSEPYLLLRSELTTVRARDELDPIVIAAQWQAGRHSGPADSFASDQSLSAAAQLRDVLRVPGVLDAAFHLATVPAPDDLRTGLSNFYQGLTRRVQTVWTRGKQSWRWACSPLTRLGELALRRAQADDERFTRGLTRFVDNVSDVEQRSSPLSDAFLFEATPLRHLGITRLPWRAGDPGASIRLRDDDEICCVFGLDKDAAFDLECHGALCITDANLSDDFTATGPPFLPLLMAYREFGWTPSPRRVRLALYAALRTPSQALYRHSFALRFARAHARTLSLDLDLAVFCAYLCVASFPDRVRRYVLQYHGDVADLPRQPSHTALDIEPVRLTAHRRNPKGPEWEFFQDWMGSNHMIFVKQPQPGIASLGTTVEWLLAQVPRVVGETCIPTESGALFIRPLASLEALSALGYLLARAFLLRCGVDVRLHAYFWALLWDELAPDQLLDDPVFFVDTELRSHGFNSQDAAAICGAAAKEKLLFSFYVAFNSVVDMEVFRAFFDPYQMERLWLPQREADDATGGVSFASSASKPLEVFGDVRQTLSRHERRRLCYICRGGRPVSPLYANELNYTMLSDPGLTKPIVICVEDQTITLNARASPVAVRDAVVRGLATPMEIWV